MTKYWRFIDLFIDAFEPLFVLTLKLQREHVPFSQLYADWLICQAQLNLIEKSNRLASKLLKAMEQRILKLGHSEPFKASLYLDPRFNFLGSNRLTASDKKEVQIRIFDTFLLNNEKISIYNSRDTCSHSANASTKFRGMNRSCIIIRRDTVEDYLTYFFNEKNIESSFEPVNDSLLGEIVKLESRQKVPISLSHSSTENEQLDILKYWHQRKYSNPRVYRLAMAVLSIPCITSDGRTTV